MGTIVMTDDEHGSASVPFGILSPSQSPSAQLPPLKQLRTRMRLGVPSVAVHSVANGRAVAGSR